jgi:hypothetical protein
MNVSPFLLEILAFFVHFEEMTASSALHKNHANKVLLTVNTITDRKLYRIPPISNVIMYFSASLPLTVPLMIPADPVPGDDNTFDGRIIKLTLIFDLYYDY